MCNPGIARLAVLLLAMWTGHGNALPVLPPLEQEVVNPGEVIFRNGVAYIDLGHGRLEPLRRRQQDGAYYRMVRYDAEFGYVRAPDAMAYLTWMLIPCQAREVPARRRLLAPMTSKAV